VIHGAMPRDTRPREMHLRTSNENEITRRAIPSSISVVRRPRTRERHLARYEMIEIQKSSRSAFPRHRFRRFA
jgi:outer membrane receptor for ferric coprogen and ferric-rhodotorulic acid